jgi:tetratricopeptide (TPR) repeat protein
VLSIERILVDLEAGRLITRMEDKVKRSLVGACQKLGNEFRDKISSGIVDTEFVFFYNMGSLLQYHYGEFDRGEQVCGHIMAMCQSLASGPKAFDWLGAMLQPYINCGRIAAARGDLDRSLDIFRRVKLFVDEKEDLRIGDYRMSIDNVCALTSGPENMVLVGRNVYMVDSARAFLFANDFHGLLQFLGSLEGDSFYCENAGNRATFLEAKARAFVGLQRYGDALHVLKEFSQFMQNDRSRIYPAIYTLSADIYWRCGQVPEAAKILLFAEKLIGRALDAASGSRNIVLAYHLYLIAVSHLLLNDDDGAIRTGSSALRIATEAGDETLVIKSLMLLLKSGLRYALKPEQIVFWRNELVSGAEATYYRLEKSLAYVFLSRMNENQACDPQGLTLACRDQLSRGLGMLNTLQSVYAKGLHKELDEYLGSSNGSQIHASKGEGEVFVRPRECVSDIIDQTYSMLIGYAPQDCACPSQVFVDNETVAEV